MKRIFFTSILLLFVAGMFAQTTFTVDSITYQTTSPTTVQLMSTTKVSSSIAIPATVAYSGINYNVTAIYNASSSSYGAFRNKTALTSVTIPSSVISIGDYSFYWCYNLTSVIIPSSVTSVGDFAFYDCRKLTSVNIPSTLISIGHSTFSGCCGLINVDSNNSAYSCIDGVLYNKAQTALIQCPTSITSVSIPNTVILIGNSAFYKCAGLTSITIPKSVISIETNALACTGLISVIIPSSVTSIGDGVFVGCSSLISATIPSSLTSIGNFTFSSCRSLKAIFVYPITPIAITSSFVFDQVNKTTCTLYVPAGSKAKYQAAAYWKDFANIVEMTTAIPEIHGAEIKPSYNLATGTLQISGLEGPATVQVYDMNGRMVYGGVCRDAACHVSTLGGNHLPAGVYVLKVKAGKETATMKMVM